jgi:hypothetical protein
MLMEEGDGRRFYFGDDGILLVLGPVLPYTLKSTKNRQL